MRYRLAIVAAGQGDGVGPHVHEEQRQARTGADQAVDTLLPKATSLTSELEKPQVEAAKLPQLASDVSDLQKQVGASSRS